MQQHPLQSHMGFYPPHNVTTEIVQKCLDENKQLILAILDNQNLGKLNDCAAYQAKLQSNLMYLAAVADSQPHPQAFHAQVPPTAVLQPGSHYMPHSQAQQQMAQHSFMVARNPLQYTQHPVASIHEAQQHQHQQLHQPQQALHGMHGLSSGGNNVLQMVSPELGMAGSSSFHSGGFPDFGRGGNMGDGLQISRGLGREVPGTKPDVMVVSNTGHSGPGVGNVSSGLGKNADDAEPLYLKASEGNGS